jgi:hypothetical protein
MAIYGRYVIYEQEEIDMFNEAYQVVQEMGFSKEDLQDPKTVQKAIEQAKKASNTADKIGNLVSLLITVAGCAFVGVTTSAASKVGAGGITFVASAIITTGVLAKILGDLNNCIDDYKRTKEDKNLEKLYKECNKLIEKSKKQMEKDKKNKQKYQDIINNATKVKESIKKHYQDKTKEEYQKILSQYMKEYKAYITFLSKEKAVYIGNMEMYYYSKILRVDEKIILDRFLYYSKKDQISYDKMIDNINDYYGFEICNEFKDIKNISKDGYWIRLVSNVLKDTVHFIYYNPKINLFVAVDDENDDYPYIAIEKSIFKLLESIFEIESHEDFDINECKKYLIDVDKELGYYRLSKAPEGVKPKEFPDKL